jgi:hypothetical protein
MLISKTRQELVAEVDTLKRQIGNLRSMQRMNQALADSLLPDEGFVKVTLPLELAQEIAGWSAITAPSALVDACAKAVEEWS